MRRHVDRFRIIQSIRPLTLALLDAANALDPATAEAVLARVSADLPRSEHEAAAERDLLGIDFSDSVMQEKTLVGTIEDVVVTHVRREDDCGTAARILVAAARGIRAELDMAHAGHLKTQSANGSVSGTAPTAPMDLTLTLKPLEGRVAITEIDFSNL